MPLQIEVDRDALGEYCRSHGIRRLALFGSVLREDFRPDSDVDVLVEWEPGSRVGLLELDQMERELSSFLGHRRLDLVPYRSLNRWIRDQVLAEAETQYAEG